MIIAQRNRRRHLEGGMISSKRNVYEIRPKPGDMMAKNSQMYMYFVDNMIWFGVSAVICCPRPNDTAIVQKMPSMMQMARCATLCLQPLSCPDEHLSLDHSWSRMADSCV